MSALARDDFGYRIQAIYPGRVQNVLIGADSAPVDQPFADTTTMLRVAVTQPCYYLIGAAPVVTAANGVLIPAPMIDFIPVKPGHKIAFVRLVSDGTANVTEGSESVE